jgi:hypothetical protein
MFASGTYSAPGRKAGEDARFVSSATWRRLWAWKCRLQMVAGERHRFSHIRRTCDTAYNPSYEAVLEDRSAVSFYALKDIR